MPPKPKLKLERNGIVIREQPPVVGDYCKTPHTGNVDAPCGYQAATCRGEPAACPRCGFAYCEAHYPTHTKAFEAPPDAWKAIMKRLNAGIERAAHANDPSVVPVRVPVEV
ncbi:MAG: hypothetical protein ACYDBQ_02135 [Thermoplasmatota archaeon]